MITSYSSIMADRANLRKCGIDIIYDISETNLYRFRIIMNNKHRMKHRGDSVDKNKEYIAKL